MSQPAHRTETLAPLGDRPLHVCGHCSSTLVQLVDYADAGAGRWALTLRCPECEEQVEGVAADAACAAYDLELERGTEALFTDMLALERSRFVAQVDAFVSALDSGLILPEDF